MVSLRILFYELSLKIAVLCSITGLSEGMMSMWVAGLREIGEFEEKKLKDWYDDFVLWTPEAKKAVYSRVAPPYVTLLVDELVKKNAKVSKNARLALLNSINDVLLCKRGESATMLTMSQIYSLIRCSKERLNKTEEPLPPAPHQMSPAPQPSTPATQMPLSPTEAIVHTSTPIGLSSYFANLSPIRMSPATPEPSSQPTAAPLAYVYGCLSSTVETTSVGGVGSVIKKQHIRPEKIFSAYKPPLQPCSKIGGFPVVWDRVACSSSLRTVFKSVEALEKVQTVCVVGWDQEFCGSTMHADFTTWTLFTLCSQDSLNFQSPIGTVRFVGDISGQANNQSITAQSHGFSAARMIKQTLENMQHGEKALLKSDCGECPMYAEVSKL